MDHNIEGLPDSRKEAQMYIGSRRMIAMILMVVFLIASMPVLTHEPAYAKGKRPARVSFVSEKVSGKTVTVRWKKAAGGKKYQVQIRYKKGKKWKKLKKIKTKNTKFSFRVFGTTKYKVRVRAVGKKKGKWSSWRVVTVKAVIKKQTSRSKPTVKDPEKPMPSIENTDREDSSNKTPSAGDTLRQKIENAKKFSYEFQLMDAYPVCIRADSSMTEEYPRRAALNDAADIYIRTANEDLSVSDLTVRNETKGKDAASGSNLARHGSAHWKDVDYLDEAKGQLKRGGLLISVDMSDAVTGDNRLALFVGDYRLGEVNVEVSDVNRSYQDFIQDTVETAVSSQYGGTKAREGTPNGELLEKLYYTTDYLESILTYDNYDVTRYLQGFGEDFHTRYVGCEAAAYMLRDMFSYLGVQAHTEYVDNGLGFDHMVVFIDDPQQYGWKAPKKFDACPPSHGDLGQDPHWGMIL